MSAVEWTPERIKILIALWDEGLPTSEIGRRLGVTKNAVVGKVHRLGLKKRQSPIRQAAPSQPKAPVKAATTAKTADAPVADAPKAEAAPAPKAKKSKQTDVVRMESLTNSMCCWPEGDPGTPEFHFCGKPAVSEKPYCEEHCARAYVKVTKKDKTAAA